MLVILLSEMGSRVLGRAMFTKLQQNYPDAAIHLLLFVRSREVLDLLGVISTENMLTVNDRSLSQFVADCFRVLRTLRALKFDVGIDCELFARSSSIFSYLLGARVRVGFHRHKQEGLYRASFLNRPVLYNPYKHIAQQFLALVAAIESQTMPVGKELVIRLPGPPPPLQFPEPELQQVAAQLHADFPALKDKSLVLVYPSGGLLPIRAWSPEHCRRLCAELLRAGYGVGIIGLPEDKSLGQDLTAHCQSAHCVDLTG